MRRIMISLGMVLFGVGLLAPTAQATFHLNMVNEVMLASASGDRGTQFVEFLDHGGTEEAFTPLFAPYKLVVYDGAGNELGQPQTLDPNGLRAAATADTEYLVSTSAADSAFGVSGNERLTVSLPATAGQVCFAGSESPPQAVSCITYGTITKPVPTNSFGTGSIHGPVPPNGESDQRQPDGTVIAASPTPKAPNRSAPPPQKGRAPTLSGLSLSGVAKQKAKLGLTAHAGSGAPGLKRLLVNLPHGLRFDARKLSGVRISGPEGSSAHLSHGALAIALSVPVPKVSVTIGGGAITVKRALADAVKHHRIKTLTVVVAVTDAKGNVTRLTASVKPT